MGDGAGMRGLASVIITREVRWFFDGTTPPAVLDWFAAVPGTQFAESREDFYDLEAARLRVGLKRRHPANTLDCKMLLSSQDGADLGFGLSGDLEDWIKISQPIDVSAAVSGKAEVRKQTRSKRFYLDANTGCEAELAEIAVDETVAWTLCFETFGDPDVRQAAMEHGVEVAFGAAGTPDGVGLATEASFNYPDWISDTVAGVGQSGLTPGIAILSRDRGEHRAS